LRQNIKTRIGIIFLRKSSLYTTLPKVDDLSYLKWIPSSDDSYIFLTTGSKKLIKSMLTRKA
jgi:hypothetical protein